MGFEDKLSFIAFQNNCLNMLVVIKLHMCDHFSSTEQQTVCCWILHILWSLSDIPGLPQMVNYGQEEAGGDILTSGIELSVVDMPVWWFDL